MCDRMLNRLLKKAELRNEMAFLQAVTEPRPLGSGVRWAFFSGLLKACLGEECFQAVAAEQ
jgi:hypothetical protein